MTTDTKSSTPSWVKLPTRIVEWVVLVLLASVGGYAGSATADETAGLRADFRQLEEQIREFQTGARKDMVDFKERSRAWQDGVDHRLRRLEGKRKRRRRKARRVASAEQ